MNLRVEVSLCIGYNGYFELSTKGSAKRNVYSTLLDQMYEKDDCDRLCCGRDTPTTRKGF